MFTTKIAIGLSSFLFAMGVFLTDIPTGVKFICLIVGSIGLVAYLVFSD